MRISEVDPDEILVAATLIRLQQECLPGASIWPLEGSFWWIARDGNGDPVGFAGLYIENHDYGQGMLCRAGVIESARGQGLQRCLIKVRERKARHLDLTRLTTYTADINVSSMNNLIACGYRTYQPTKGWASAGFVYWAKQL
jgi:RimJ/RimL family protein N-acetyltransferase